jgi:hypothetical protein
MLMAASTFEILREACLEYPHIHSHDRRIEA